MPEESATIESTPPQRPRHRRIALLVVVILAAGALAYRWRTAGLDHPPPTATGDRLLATPNAARGFNVLVITIDTLRADRVGCYGYTPADTPNIDALAANGALFLDAMASVPITLASHATIFTGLYPPRHTVRNNGGFLLSPEQVTLAERLSDAGYDTAAFISAYVLMARYGLDQGFDVYDDDLLSGSGVGGNNDVVDRPANEVNDSFLKWYGQRRQAEANPPFFAWIHYYDPHSPYEPPPPFDRRFVDEPYDGEIAFADAQLGRVIEALQDAAELDKTLIVLLSDHGESHGEHGEASHSHLIYDATMKVPLILSNPRLFPQPQIIGGSVAATADVVPTVLSLLGLPAEDDWDGVNLVAPPSVGRAVYIESLVPKLMNGWSPLYGMRAFGEKYIRAPREEYYDIASDRRELDNLFTARPEEAARLSALLDDYQAKWGIDETAPAPVDPEQIAKLEALGYVGDSDAVYTGADPKDMIHVWEKYHAAKGLMKSRRYEAAEDLLTAALQDSPDDPYGYRMLSQLYLKMKRMQDARECAERLVELLPNSTDARAVLASACLGVGDRACFDAQVAIGMELDPNEPELHLARGDGAAMAGKYHVAIMHFRRVMELDRAKYGDLARKKIARAKELAARADRGSP